MFPCPMPVQVRTETFPVRRNLNNHAFCDCISTSECDKALENSGRNMYNPVLLCLALHVYECASRISRIHNRGTC